MIVVMGKSKKVSSNRADYGRGPVVPNAFLRTEKDHSKWFKASYVGKQGGRPRTVSERAKPKRKG